MKGGEYQRKPKRQTRQKVAQNRDARIVVAMRSQGVCEARLPTVCEGRATNYHHRDPRGMGGTKAADTPENLVHLCGSGTTGCHGWIESHRDRAKELKLLLVMGEDPAKTPVRWDLMPWLKQ